MGVSEEEVDLKVGGRLEEVEDMAATEAVILFRI